MTRLSRATYSLMVSLLPATATAIGIIVLAQIPSALELLGIGLVIAGVAVHRDRNAAQQPNHNDDSPREHEPRPTQRGARAASN